jgi:hypothetical protein
MQSPPRPASRLRARLTPILLALLALWGAFTTSLVAHFILTASTNPDEKAIIRMALCLIAVWCLAAGALMLQFQNSFVAWVLSWKLPFGWRTRFVLLCILFACLEEAVTTSLTNLAPWLGGATDAARITASKNYLEVILRHSVVAFIPLFIAWAWLLKRYDFTPAEVFLLFGLNGTLAETLSFGPQNLLGVGMWTFVYGWMVYLPARTVPPDRTARPARWYHALLAAFLPLVFVFPLALWLLAQCARFLVSQLPFASKRKESLTINIHN